ncbi:hypothetical protein [Streptomyces sp. NPDC005476]|uniref:hypothetical protein n=1 Tax=Streptomyces sp. NPDC005476 TaxID=3156882 RepID=UPI00345278AA
MGGVVHGVQCRLRDPGHQRPAHSAPAAKGIVERTFGIIDALLGGHLPGCTGSDVTRRGPYADTGACFSVAQLHDLLDERLIRYHHRPHATAGERSAHEHGRYEGGRTS